MTEDQKRALSNWLPGRISHLNDKESIQEGGLTAGQFFQRASYQIALAALTHPGSLALKLPDAKPDHDNEEGNDIDYLEPSQVYSLGFDDGFNRCLREVVKINAPHTAPIEPIYATGGAEWVKLPEGKVESGVNGRFYHNEGWNKCLAEVKRLNGVE